MGKKDVLAIDFGTANTYYCRGPNECPAGRPSASGVQFKSGKDGLTTAILYREGKPPLVGDLAFQEYGNARPEERKRKGYTLRMHFKPDISTNTEAWRNACDFLAGVIEEGKKRKLDIDPTQREVIVGVPSEAADDYRNALSKAARDAGYGEIRMVDEPKGALLHQVYYRGLPVGEALKGLLVVDFGGGTCDFAFMRRGKVLHSWGDMRLGGRLFDDLFFQWFLEANPDALGTWKDEDREFYVLWTCREKKESFSESMTGDRNQKCTLTIDNRWRIADATWDEFTRRAWSYRPSPTFTQFLASTGGLSSKLGGSEAGIDLLGWFRDCLRQGIRDGKIDKSDMRFVILAGGSSQWPFVADIVCEELSLDESRLMRSDRPYAAISEGLAILPALQDKFRITQERLRKELPQFCNQALKSLLDRRSQCVAQEIAAGVTLELFEEKLKPLLVEFRTQGGSVASLKARLASTAASFEPRLRSLIEERVSVLTTGLPSAVKELVAKWFDRHGLVSPDGDMVVEGVDADNVEKPGLEVPDFLGTIIGVAGGAVIGPLIAMICGGGGFALITSGPIGWIIGLILGAVIAYLTLKYGPVKAKLLAEKWNVPKWILKRTLTDRKIAKAREKLAADIETAAQRELSGMQDGLVDQVSQQVEREIDALSDINHL